MKLLIIIQSWNYADPGSPAVALSSQVIECMDAAHAATTEAVLRGAMASRSDMDIVIVQLPDPEVWG